MSDITTNIIRRHLIEYTHQQFELMGQAIEPNLPTGRLWVRGEGRWESAEFDRIPIINNKRVLLVPRRYVRWRGAMQQLVLSYYTHFVTNFVREEQLRTNGHLIRVLRSKRGERREVYKRYIKQSMPPTKYNLASFSVENPEVYRRFKQVITRRGLPGLRRLMELDGAPFEEGVFNAEAGRLLGAVPPGRPNATAYHHLVGGVMTYLFYPSLITPTLEQNINQGRKRIDIAFANAAPRGFLAEVRADPFLLAREIMVECKNYQEDLANNELDQMIGRFDPRRGRFGMIVCRSIADPNRLLERCRDAFRAQQGAFIVFMDDDFQALLALPELGRTAAIEAMCRRKFRALMQ